MHPWLGPLLKMHRRRAAIEKVRVAMLSGKDVLVISSTEAEAKRFVDDYAKTYPGEPLPPTKIDTPSGPEE